MKKAKKVMALVLCAALLMAGSVMGTLAYLTAQDSVTNTFTVGNVAITLQEYVIDPQTGSADKSVTPVKAQENIELAPGRVIGKNPFITVGATSEDCWLVVKIENGLGDIITIDGMDSWNEVTGKPGYFMYNTAVSKCAKVDVFTSITCNTDNTNAALEAVQNKQIIVTAYAIQAENVTKDNVIAYLGTHYTLN